MDNWISDVRNFDTADVGVAFGLKKTRGNALAPCPACSATQRGSSDRRGPVGLRTDGQGWRCFKCEVGGDGADLAAWAAKGKSMRQMNKEEMSGMRNLIAKAGFCSKKDGSMRITAAVPIAQKKKQPEQRVPAGVGSALRWRDDLVDTCAQTLWDESGAAALAYLQGRGFNEAALKHWKIGCLNVQSNGKVVDRYVVIPVLDRDGVPVNARFRSVPGKCLRCGGSGCSRCKDGEVKKIYLRSPGRPTTLFGVQSLAENFDNDVLICEGELDVIAMWQYGYDENVVSGTAGAGTWAEEWLDLLEPYKHFILSYDSDEAGDKGAKSVADKLGKDRCSRARLPRNDAAQCLTDAIGADRIFDCLENSQPLLEATLVKVDAYAGEIEDLINNPDQLRGLTTGSTVLDEALGGWRPGLVIVTGDTAAGKTSWTTWAALEQARRGVPVLLTSFEQRPIGTVQKLLRSEVGCDFTHVSAQERAVAMQQLGKLPIFMVDHYGHLASQELEDIISYSVRRRDVRVAVVDHLGFMVDGAEDERRAIEAVVRKYAVVAVQMGITILMVAHPNNMSVAQQRRVKLGDLKGASAIRQDAHVGLVLERLQPGRGVDHPAIAVHVDKCRSEFGLQGSRVVQYYDPQACVYADEWALTPSGSAGIQINPVGL